MQTPFHPEQLVGWLQFGFLGLAGLSLMLASFLLYVVSTSDLEENAISIRVQAIKYFMIFTLLIVLTGLGWEALSRAQDWRNPEVTLGLYVTPRNIAGLSMRVGAFPVEWQEDGALFTATRNETLVVDLGALNNKLTDLDSELKKVRTELKKLQDYTRETKQVQLRQATGQLKTNEVGP